MPAKAAESPARHNGANKTTEFHVVVSDAVPDEALVALKKVARVTACEGVSKDELKKLLREADALIVRSGTKVTAELLEDVPRMRVIGRAGVGVDNIDVKAATQKGIIVVNSPEGNTMSAAEHTVALILSMMRHIPRAAESMRAGEWKRSKFTGSEIYNKTVGVVGLGKIGREVASRMRAFKARVIAQDPFVTAEHAAAMDLELADLDTVLREADIVTVHTPLTPETKGMIGPKQLAMMKKGSRIVNCARGGIIDEEALYDALHRGHLAGAALDVLATPHLGASTEEAQMKVAVDVAEQIVDVLEGRPARAAVNMPSLPPEQMALLEPYVYLGERMGSFVAQITQGAIHTVEVTYAGDMTRLRLEPVTWGILKGLLSVSQGETVNYVNAGVIAAERGIQIKESRAQQARDYVNLIEVRVATESEERRCEGTLFGAREPRIVTVDGHRMDLNPVGHKLLTWQSDQPGVVGRIGTVLGEHNINIAEMQVGRDTPRGHALMVLSIDEAVAGDLLAKIRKVAGIKDARTVTLA
jgi:D-3-phosphoglycerate dehydrogenase